MLGKGKNENYADDARTKVSTLIGEGTVFDGDLTSPETIRIDGVINGNCTCEKKLILSAEGQVRGNISAQSVIYYGFVPDSFLRTFCGLFLAGDFSKDTVMVYNKICMGA